MRLAAKSAVKKKHETKARREQQNDWLDAIRNKFGGKGIERRNKLDAVKSIGGSADQL